MFYLAQKPLKMGSNLLIKILKRVIGAQKIGFAGTLDPLATGLMIIGTDGSSRLFSLLEDRTKTYKTTIRLDGTTPSHDLENPPTLSDIPDEKISSIDRDTIQSIINNHFTGEIQQVPPNYSAVWIDGQRAYDRARKGETSTIASKPRTIHSFKINSYKWPQIVCTISVSHGTYIRSIAHDLGELLGTGGYLESLERISIGDISLSTARTWIAHNDILYTPIKHSEIFPNFPIIALDEAQKSHIRLGSTPLSTELPNGLYLVSYDDTNHGLLESRDGLLFPLKNNV